MCDSRRPSEGADSEAAQGAAPRHSDSCLTATALDSGHERCQCTCHDSEGAAPRAEGLDVLDWLKEHAHEFWSDESVMNDYAFHPSLFWRWLGEAREHFARPSDERQP